MNVNLTPELERFLVQFHETFCLRCSYMLAPEIIANTRDQFFSPKLAIRLDNCSLAVCPVWLDWTQPRAFDRQLQALESHPPCSFDCSVVVLYSATHFLALVPTGVVPDQGPHSFAFSCQATTDPIEEV
jgi:hypothetical protein